MDRLLIVKSVLFIHIDDACNGLFFNRNLLGDTMTTVYKCDGLQVDICYMYRYFEVFGLSEEEQQELTEFYNKLLKERRYK